MQRRKKPCTINDCSNVEKAKGLCAKHYYRLVTNGATDIVYKKMPSHGVIAKWVSDHLTYSGVDCLLWPFSHNGVGYGMFSHKGKRMLVSRHLCATRNGPPPTPTHQAAHKCGNGHKGCVNPAHLEWATPKENCLDKYDHGTHHRGQQCSYAKLTPKDVSDIRQRIPFQSQNSIARDFGISQSAVSMIKRRKIWASA
jgi:hypothetical protein